ncbi:MAG: N-acetyl-alpha-D-glucosaminyl L-malate synthase BshA [Bacteroidia bacterium]|nr:N-acetyl-alpha-D-glucosaminyl L-malate synthase BshA [Bacteroidia bacterium]
MKIGMVCYPTYGGSGVIATELGKGLAKLGHQIHFITYKQPPRLNTFQENIFYHEVLMSDYPLFEHAPYDTYLTSKIVDVVKHEQLDILHVHYAVPHATIAYLAKKILLYEGRYVPTVTTLHGTDITLVGKDRSIADVVAFAIEKSDGVTAVSNSLKKDTYAYFGVQKDIEVIYNFIDLERFTKTNKDHFKKAIAPNGEKIMVHTSNFRKVKRVEDCILIFKEVNQRIPSKLILVGDGPERRNLEDLCRELGLCQEIRFLGKQDAIEEILAIGDAFLMPSGKESFGLAALEAMACEVPVISSDVGGISEVNVHGETGFISKVGNVEEMAANTIRLLSDEKLHGDLKRNAFARAQEFDIEKILPQYEAFYNKVLEEAVYDVA